MLGAYKQFVQKIPAAQPVVPIDYIAITPSPLRWDVQPIAQQTKALIAGYAALDENLHVIDTGDGLMETDGMPNSDNYRFDGLQLSADGHFISALSRALSR